jgi:fumarylacetoacetase
VDLAGGALSSDAPSRSWVPVPEGSGFGLDNLPFGVGSVDGGRPHVLVAIGDHALDLDETRRAGAIDLPKGATRDSLDRILPVLGAVRAEVHDLLADPGRATSLRGAVVAQSAVSMRMPFGVADFVDFYSSEVHATTVGRILRPDGDPLPPAWKHLPIAYHGRSGTVVVSGTPVIRPAGQRLSDGVPTFGPTERLDFELEMGTVIGRPSNGPVPVERALEHVAGFVLLNDWSARDIQAWEYQPLGPFAGKSFATTIGPWVVPLDALAPFERAPAPQAPDPLAHLRPAGPTWGIDLTAAINGEVVARASFADLYWTVSQQIAHLTANGARLRVGDLLGSGTISSDGRGGAGSLLEAGWNGTRPITVGGEAVPWLRDGDSVTLRASADHDGAHIDFGACSATVQPTIDQQERGA